MSTHAGIVARISQEMNGRYLALQKQHQEFAAHLNGQITALEHQIMMQSLYDTSHCLPLSCSNDTHNIWISGIEFWFFVAPEFSILVLQHQLWNCGLSVCSMPPSSALRDTNSHCCPQLSVKCLFAHHLPPSTLCLFSRLNSLAFNSNSSV